MGNREEALPPSPAHITEFLTLRFGVVCYAAIDNRYTLLSQSGSQAQPQAQNEHIAVHLPHSLSLPVPLISGTGTFILQITHPKPSLTPPSFSPVQMILSFK